MFYLKKLNIKIFYLIYFLYFMTLFMNVIDDEIKIYPNVL